MLCADIDILKLEPTLFAGTSFPFPSQSLCRGANGALAGTAFSAAGMNYTSQGVAVGHVIYLSDGVGNIDGVYEIVNVVSTTQLTLSVVRSNDTASAISIGSGSNLFFRISTFGPQIAQAEYELSQRLRLKPGFSDSAYDLTNLADQKNLKAACVFWSLSRIFGSRYGSGTGDGLSATWTAYQNKMTDYMERAEISLRHLKLAFTGL